MAYRKCEDCMGTGVWSWAGGDCQTCDGSGIEEVFEEEYDYEHNGGWESDEPDEL